MANKTKKNTKDKAASDPKVNGTAPTAPFATASSPEADKVKFMISEMAKSVKEGSEWYIVSMNWINKWQKYVGFDCEA
jgi:hypothetical protein